MLSPLDKTVAVRELLECDAIAQEASTEINLLLNAAIDSLALDVHSLVRARQYMLMATHVAMEMTDNINTRAREEGANYEDRREVEFIERVERTAPHQINDLEAHRG